MSNEFKIGPEVWHETWKGWALVVTILLATAGVCYGVSPWFIQQETMNTRGSLSYISTHKGILRQLKTSYDAIEARINSTPDTEDNRILRTGLRNQQRSIILQMRQEADLIPRDVPSDIQDILHATP